MDKGKFAKRFIDHQEHFEKGLNAHEKGHDTGFSKALAIIMAIFAFIAIGVAIVLPLLGK